MTNNIARLCSLLILSTIAAFAAAEDYNGDPTGHLIHRHNPSEISAMIADGWRPTSIGYESSNDGGQFRVAYVQNTDSHYKECILAGNNTEADINAIRSLGWRIEDIEYRGNSRFAAIFIRNLVEPRTTTWFAWQTSTQVQTWLNNNPTYRLLEIDRSQFGNTERYSGVFIRNVGAGYVSGWGWHSNSTLATISQWANDNNMRVVDLDRGANGRYAAVHEPAANGQRFYWFQPASFSRVLEILQGMGLRAVTISPRVQGGTTTYTMTAVNNTNAQSARLADMAWPLHNGFQGFYVHRIGGGKSVALNDLRAFHPSSSFKTLFHYTGAATTAANLLNTRVISGTLMVTRHQRMMWNSNNTDSNLLMDTYTIPVIEDLMHNTVGMSQVTQIRNRMGTGGPYGNDEINETTLVDMGILYRAIQDGDLGTAKTNWMRANMLNETNSGAFNTVIQSERASVGLTNNEFNSWFFWFQYVLKPGSNSSGGITGYWSVCGVMTLPFMNDAGLVLTRNYLFGHFVNRSTISYSGWGMTAETMREQIRASMETFD